MPDENELSSDDKAYFESRGETLPPEKTDVKTQATEEAQAETDGLLDDEGVDKVEEKVEKVVPLRALTKEREEAKKLRATLQEYEKKQAVLEDRWNTILQLQSQQEPAKADEDPEPDPNKDIFAHNAWLKRQLVKVTTGLSERDQTEKQAKEAAEAENKLWGFWQQDAIAYKAQNAEFDDAVKWGSDYRTKQLQAMADLYPQFASEAGIADQINRELREIVITALNARKSPAEVVHKLVKSWGYQGKPADPAASEVAKLAKDIDAETSLSSAGGSRPGTGLTPKDIADMSPEQFDAWYAKAGAAGFKRLHQRGSA